MSKKVSKIGGQFLKHAVEGSAGQEVLDTEKKKLKRRPEWYLLI